jgi:AbrB family looped-hinge helix DNA binding protein
MKTTMDQTGRVVIPAEARAQAHLTPGQQFEVRVVDGGVIEMDPVYAPIELIDEGGLQVMDAGATPHRIDDDDVRRAIDEARHRRTPGRKA